MNWEDMTPWQKFTDKDPSRPAKTWRNRIFWTWPITHFTETVGEARPRIEQDTFTTSAGEKPCLHIKLGYRCQDYKDRPLYNAAIVIWNGWFWGWK